ncbi:hypothetical protein K1719_024040 [Acacia pycnantha]|nr:hypothetical protein K1719_024040 [Acacia pycnantha]
MGREMKISKFHRLLSLLLQISVHCATSESRSTLSSKRKQHLVKLTVRCRPPYQPCVVVLQQVLKTVRTLGLCLLPKSDVTVFQCSSLEVFLA